MSQEQLVKNSEDSSENLFKSFIRMQENDIQTRKEETDIRKKELELETQKDKHNFEFSKEALNLQYADKKDDRSKKHSFYNSLRNTLFISLLIVIILFCFAIYFGKETIVIEIVKIGGTAAISIFGGYYVGYSKGKDKSNDNN